MFTIEKTFTFEASHRLNGLADGHPCGKWHGHSYSVTLTLKGEVNEIGFVRDYRDLDAVKLWIDATLDHACLNDVMKENPTAEHIARMIFYSFREQLPEMTAVTVKETAKTSATYEPNDA